MAQVTDRYLPANVLIAVRGRIGVEDNEADTSQDHRILAMSPRAIVRNYFGWKLGDDSWGDNAISVIEAAYGIKLKE